MKFRDIFFFFSLDGIPDNNLKILTLAQGFFPSFY